MKNYLISASILSANFLKLQLELEIAQNSGVDWFHFDVMDGNFVPNLTFGPKILAEMRTFTSHFIDCHLMVNINNQSLTEYVWPYINAGASAITFHYEALSNQQLSEFLLLSKVAPIKIGLALKPDTDVKKIISLLDKLDLILIMTVEPGFGGQNFIPRAAEKIKFLENYRKLHNLSYLISVDGGINEKTAQLCRKNGIDVMVAGSYLFGQQDFKERVQKLKYGK